MFGYHLGDKIPTDLVLEINCEYVLPFVYQKHFFNESGKVIRHGLVIIVAMGKEWES